MSKQIKEGALFIADAHYPHHGEKFLKILQMLQREELSPPQIFLMGDIFDLLFGYNSYIQTFSKEAIELLQTLSKIIEIIYLEGNHDFALKEIFPNILIYSRDEQPIHYRLNNQDVYLSHGDKYETGLGYNFYSKLLRNRFTLSILRPFEKKIIDHRMYKLKRKNICSHFVGFQKRFEAILQHYPKDALVIEGHFHQAVKEKSYISLPSLACQGEVAMVKEGEIIFIEL